MKLQSLFFLVFLSFSFTAQSQLFSDSSNITGTWIERQGRNEIGTWIFHPGGNFTNVSSLSGETPFLQGYIFKGQYIVDTVEMTISISYDEVTSLRNNITRKIDSGSYKEEWKILQLDSSQVRLMEIQYYIQASGQGKNRLR